MSEVPRVRHHGEASIVLIGFMGAGKSTWAQVLAAQLGVESVDSDALLVDRHGCSIDELFARDGEERFRDYEQELTLELLAGPERVIALGAGAVLRPSVQRALEHHTVVWLDVDRQTAWQRVKGQRPLAHKREQFFDLFAERRAHYGALADAVIPATSDVDCLAAAAKAVSTLHHCEVKAKLLWAPSSVRSYPIYFGEELLQKFWPVDGRGFLVTDSEVGPRYGEYLNHTVAQVTLGCGEQQKNLDVTHTVLRDLARAGAQRGDHVIGLGGGVVGDIAGFCAAVYQRGIDLVHVPTTLLAQVDSAYGGKAGVDLPEGKNYVGVFYPPRAVISDRSTLSSLPTSEVACGWAEIIKTGLLVGGELWLRVKRSAGPNLPDAQMIFDCAHAKISCVAADELDLGPRQVLNLGHTVGHALESMTSYQHFRHGEAVSIGLLAALTLSSQPELRDEVRELLARCNLPVELREQVDDRELIAAVKRDKKNRGGRLRFVLIDGVGQPRIGCPVPERDLVSAINELHS